MKRIVALAAAVLLACSMAAPVSAATSSGPRIAWGSGYSPALVTYNSSNLLHQHTWRPDAGTPRTFGGVDTTFRSRSPFAAASCTATNNSSEPWRLAPWSGCSQNPI